MIFTADQIVAHLVGDYIIQSHWMANEKTKRSVAAAAHAVVYTLPFLLITQNAAALAIICGTHFVIDRWRLARFIVRWKNQLLAGREGPDACSKYRTATGYPDDTPPWLAVWLLIIADNTLHLLCNGLAIWWFA